MTPNSRPDVFIGLAFVAGGVLIVIGALGLRSIPGLPVGPGLFPTITGGAMALFGAVVAVQALVPAPARDAAATTIGDTGAVDLAEADEPRDIARLPFIPSLLAAIAAIVAAMPVLGFLITGTLLTAFLARLGGARWIAALVFAPLVTLAVRWLFVGGLRVPLPPGLLG